MKHGLKGTTQILAETRNPWQYAYIPIVNHQKICIIPKKEIQSEEELNYYGLTKWEEMIRGNSAATSIPWTSGSSKPAVLADSGSKWRGLESWLTLEYSRTSSLEYILVCLKISPVLSTFGSSDEKHLTTKGNLLESGLLINILAIGFQMRRNNSNSASLHSEISNTKQQIKILETLKWKNRLPSLKQQK